MRDVREEDSDSSDLEDASEGEEVLEADSDKQKQAACIGGTGEGVCGSETAHVISTLEQEKRQLSAASVMRKRRP